MIPDGIASWLSRYSALEAALTVIAILGAIALTWNGAKRAWPGLVSFVEFVKSLGALPGFMTETSSQLREIRHEVLPNKGGSLRDDVETVTLLAEKLNEQLTQLHDHGRTDHARLKVLEDAITRRREQRAIIQQEADSGGVSTYPADTSEE